MQRRSLTFTLIALATFAAAAAATEAKAGACCKCAYTCAPPVPVQIWGLSPVYVVNQGPVFRGPGFYTAPIYEGEQSTARYPYAGSSDFFDAGADPFRKNLYHPYWPMLRGLRPHVGRYHPAETGALDRRGPGSQPVAVADQPALRARTDAADGW